MWAHAKQGTRFFGDIAGRCPSTLDVQFFGVNDGAIKLRLPERLLAAVVVLSYEHNISRPDALRWLLFEHVYGRIELLHLLRRNRAPLTQITYENATEYRSPLARLQQLDKSAYDLELELPEDLRRSLEGLAGRSNEYMSPYMRRVLARDLLPESEYLFLFHMCQCYTSSANSVLTILIR